MNVEQPKQTIVTSIDELIEEASKATLDAKQLHYHMQMGTVDVLAEQLSNQFIEAAMLIPLVRKAEGLPSVEDVEDLIEAVATIVNLISTYTNIPPDVIQRRADRIVKQFPATDIQHSTYLRYTNQLH